ncbi:ester cyclase [Sphingomonas psychrotolerans]|uniref:Ester cyclase n=1 Tax=Sphingomonas psychrotolerans TaxID=1327635 RepID=A0A2K8MM61_9SPHN|nr:ester cyclase [Sphingomonas psychrotolerans]ATY34905.1 hypothetical protein CVN68_22605 [Sphingomonas psychrotolerans]
MSEVDLRNFFGRYIAALNSHNFQQLSEFMHDDMIVNGQPMTREQMVTVLEEHVDAVPDLMWRPQDLAIDGNQVAARFYNKGTPIKEWLGSPPNGATVEYVEHVFHKIRDGRFVEQNFLLDALAIQQQLNENP